MQPEWVMAKVRFLSGALLSVMLLSVFPMLVSGSDISAAANNTRVTMLDCAGLPCVTVQITAGHSVKLLFDSGDAVSVLDTRRAKALHLPLVPYRSRTGQLVPGVFLAQVSGVRLGSIVLPPTRFAVMDLAQNGSPPCDGMLSYVALMDRTVTLDYAHHLITVSDPGAQVTAPGDAGVLTYPTFGKKGPHIVATTGFEVNGEPVTVQVDTLYSGTLLIYPTSVSKLGLDAQAASVRRRRFPFTDGGVDMIEGKALKESFAAKSLLTNAPLYFATPQVHLPDGMFDGTVGAQLFTGHSMTFDFHANRFWIT